MGVNGDVAGPRDRRRGIAQRDSQPRDAAAGLRVVE